MTLSCEISKEDTIVLIRSLLSSINSPCSVYTLNKDFRAETGFDIPLYGYESLSDFLRSIPDTVKTTGIPPVEKVQLVSDEKSAHIVSLVKRQKQTSKKSGKRTTKNSFSNYYPKTNSYTYVGEHNILPKPKHKEYGAYKHNTKVFTNSDKVNCTENITYKEKEVVKLPPVPKGPPPFKEVLRFEDKIFPLDLNEHAQVGEYVEVCPSKVYDPHKFYLHLRKNKKKLGRLMNELQLFYQEDTDSFLMPSISIKCQRTCAVLYQDNSKESEWYRAEITNINNDSEVTVILIDYGIVARIPKKNLRYLHRRFSSLPKQSFLGSLANIKPSNEEWSKSASERFSKLVTGKDLIAGVVEMNTTLNIPWMGVALSFTKDTEIHINDILVKEGYAMFEPGYGCDWQVSLSSTKTSNQGSRMSSSTTGESAESRFPRKDATSQVEKILYVPRNDRLKQLFLH